MFVFLVEEEKANGTGVQWLLESTKWTSLISVIGFLVAVFWGSDDVIH